VIIVVVVSVIVVCAVVSVRHGRGS
jgi:hypothetical protein